MAARATSCISQRLLYNCSRCQMPSRPHQPLHISRRATKKHFSSSRVTPETMQIRAAPEVDFAGLGSSTEAPARVIPASPSYFTASPQFNDNLLHLQYLVRENQNIPTIAADKVPPVAWLKLAQYRGKLGEPVPASKYAKVLGLLSRLNQIHPQLRSSSVTDVIEQFRRPGSAELQKPKEQTLDVHGRARGVGRRKESSARVYLVEGTGEVLVNGKSIVQVFPRLHDRESALWALKVTHRMDKYNVWALVKGGGVTGQAESITLALAKALLVHEPALKPALRRAGTVTRDPRRVERKKPGRLKARKKSAWVKR